MSKFFIDRPVFAWVIAIIIMLAGGLTIRACRSRSIPRSRRRRSASPRPIPARRRRRSRTRSRRSSSSSMNGIDNLRYIVVVERLDRHGARSRSPSRPAPIPTSRRCRCRTSCSSPRRGCRRRCSSRACASRKSTRNFLMVVGFVSERRQHDPQRHRRLRRSRRCSDPISRVPGVGDVQLFGTQYAMRIWLDPDKLHNYGLTPADVVAAIQAQNAQVSAGQLGGLPAVPGQQLNATITAQTPAADAGAVRRHPAARQHRRLAGAAQRRRARRARRARATTSTRATTASRRPASAIQLATGANALDTADAVRATHRPSCRRSSRRASKSVYPLRHDAVRAHLDRGSGEDAARGDRAGVPRDVPVPAELARHADPDDRGAGRAARHVRRAGGVRLLDQHADDVRHGAGDRPAGRRRDRRRRERRAHHERGRAVAARRRRARRWTRSPARWSASRWCSRRCSCRWRSSAARSASSTASSRSRSSSAMALSVLVALILTPALCATILKPLPKGARHAPRRGFFGWFNRGFDRGSDALRARRRRMLAQRRAAACSIYRADRRRPWRCCSCACPPSFLPDEDQGILYRPGAAAAGRDAGAHAGRCSTQMRAALPRGREGRGRAACSPSPASASPAAARTPASPSSSSRTGTSARRRELKAQRGRRRAR